MVGPAKAYLWPLAQTGLEGSLMLWAYFLATVQHEIFLFDVTSTREKQRVAVTPEKNKHKERHCMTFALQLELDIEHIEAYINITSLNSALSQLNPTAIKTNWTNEKSL